MTPKEELAAFAEYGKQLTPMSALRAENAMLRAKLTNLRAAAADAHASIEDDRVRMALGNAIGANR